MEITTIKLDEIFEGKGEVKGFVFRRVNESEFGYIYEVKTGNRIYYEVFKKRSSPVCIDFDKKTYSETEYKEIYPNSKQFGISAWHSETLKNAELRLETFNIKQ